MSVFLLLAALLFWAQLAVAVHDISHITHEESDTCGTFLMAADNAKALSLEDSQLSSSEYIIRLIAAKNISIIERFAPAYSARSPPFFSTK